MNRIAHRAFHRPEARDQAKAAIQAIEAHTSAEVVIAVRHTSGDYRFADSIAGFAIAWGTLMAMLYATHRFRLVTFPLYVLIAFVFGALVCSIVPPLRRALSSKTRRLENVRRAALAAFVELGVHRCSGRWGILIYVSTFERRLEVVTDVGIDAVALGDPWRNAIGVLQSAVADDVDFDRILSALRALGPALGRVLPRRADDVNELSDEIVDASA